MIFNLFDFDNNHGLDLDEVILMTICLIEGWGRFTRRNMPQRTDLEKLGKAIFSVREGRIGISEIAGWIDLNRPFTNLLKFLNPHIQEYEEPTETFLPLTRPK